MARRRRKPNPEAKALLDSFRPHYEELLASQGGACSICGRPPSERRRLDIDHDHRTMEVRGLLCHRCNRTLAAWISPKWLRDAAKYLGGRWLIVNGVPIYKRKRNING